MDLDPGSPVWSSAKGNHMGIYNERHYLSDKCLHKEEQEFPLLRVRREGVEDGGVKEMEEEREGGRERRMDR